MIHVVLWVGGARLQDVPTRYNFCDVRINSPLRAPALLVRLIHSGHINNPLSKMVETNARPVLDVVSDVRVKVR
jgi:hypothetical protein